MNYLGEFNTSARVDDQFTMVTTDGTPTAVTSGSLVCRRLGQSTLAPAGITAITTSGGLHTFTIFTGSATSYFIAGWDYSTYFGAGTITTTSVIGYVVHQFSILNRVSNVVQVNGSSAIFQSAADVADAVWDEARSGHASAGTYGESITGVVNTVSANVKQILSVATAGTAGYVAVDWANTTGTATLNTNVQNVRGAGINALISGRVDANTQVIAAGAIASATFSTGALDAAALAQDAAREIADEFLNRDLAGSASGGARIVRDALRGLRNKTVITTTGQIIVYREDDTTTAWTGITTTATAISITSVDPA